MTVTTETNIQSRGRFILPFCSEGEDIPYSSVTKCKTLNISSVQLLCNKEEMQIAWFPLHSLSPFSSLVSEEVESNHLLARTRVPAAQAVL